MPKLGAPVSTARRYADHDGLLGSKRTATRFRDGTHSLRTCSHLLAMENWKLVKPVMFPSGRARFVTNPPLTGSATKTKTMGTERVCCLRVIAAWVLEASSTSGRISS